MSQNSYGFTEISILFSSDFFFLTKVASNQLIIANQVAYRYVVIKKSLDFVNDESPMGLERLEVRFFFREKFTKFDLALNGVSEILVKLVQRVLMLF